MAHYLFNLVRGDAAPGPALRELATGFLRVGVWGVGADERRRSALAEKARADFDMGVVRITAGGYEPLSSWLPVR